MVSMIRNGGGLVPTAVTQFYETPDDTDENVQVRITNIAAEDHYIYIDLVSPDGSQIIPVAFNGRVEAGDAVDGFKAGFRLGQHWKARHRASDANCLVTFWSATPAT